jgi:nitroreductase
MALHRPSDRVVLHRRAPSAGNAQNWAFIVIREAEQRRKLGRIYRKASEIASAMYAARGRPAHLTEQ